MTSRGHVRINKIHGIVFAIGSYMDTIIRSMTLNMKVFCYKQKINYLLLIFAATNIRGQFIPRPFFCGYFFAGIFLRVLFLAGTFSSGYFFRVSWLLEYFTNQIFAEGK